MYVYWSYTYLSCGLAALQFKRVVVLTSKFQNNLFLRSISHVAKNRKMPVDNKRIACPEDSVPYQLYDKLNTKSLKVQFCDVVKPDGTRIDGRKHEEHRKISLKTGVVSQAKGSAYIELDDTKVIVSVFDPREIPNKTDYSLKGEIYCEFKYAPFSCHKRRLHQQDAEEQQYSAIMKQALESAVFRHEFPNFQVDIYALVLHNDGSALSAAITAAGAALAHAGVPLYDLITCATVAVQGNFILVDPTFEEECLCQAPCFKEEGADDHGIIVMSMLATHEQVSQFYQSGNLSFEKICTGLERLTEVNKDILALVKKCLVLHVMKNIRDVED